MWESGRPLPDFQARWKGWETSSGSFPCFPWGGISTAPARGVRSAATIFILWRRVFCASTRPASRCGARCAPAGRGCCRLRRQARIRGQEHQVGADTVGALFLIVQHAHKDADNGQNHDDFNGHGQHADDRAHGAVQKVGKDELIHIRSSIKSANSAESPSLRVTAGCGRDGAAKGTAVPIWPCYKSVFKP